MVVSTIPVIALPKQEQDGARNLNTYLSQLDEYRSRFRSALALFDEPQRIVQIEESRRDEILERMSQTIKSCPVIEIEKLRPVHRERAILLMESKNATMIPRDWYFMAVRDAAFTIFHFGETFGAIRDTLARCPKLLGLVGDISPEILSSRIPDHKSVRHAVGHEAQNLRDFLQSGMHGVGGPHTLPGIKIEAGAKSGFMSNLHGRTYMVTVKPNNAPASVCSIEISVETLSALESVCADVFSAFAQASETLRLEYLANRALNAHQNHAS